jgi:hypothetical protein
LPCLANDRTCKHAGSPLSMTAATISRWDGADASATTRPGPHAGAEAALSRRRSRPPQLALSAEAVRVSHQRRLALGCGRMRSSVSVPSGLTTAPLLSDSSRTGAPRIVTAVADEARVPRWRDRRRAAVVRSSLTARFRFARSSRSRSCWSSSNSSGVPSGCLLSGDSLAARCRRCGRRHDVGQACVGHRRGEPEGRPRRFQSTGSVSESSSGSEPSRYVRSQE